MSPWAANADAVVIADGAYLLRPELRDLWDFRIFVEIDFDLVLARGRGSRRCLDGLGGGGS